MFQRHWIDFARGYAIDGYMITDAGRRALARAGPCMTAAELVETEARRREARKMSQKQRQLECIAEGQRWRAEIEESVARDRYLYLKRWWDCGKLFDTLTEEFLSLQQRFDPNMCNQTIKYRQGARVLIEVTIPYDQVEDAKAVCVHVPNRSSNPTQVNVPAGALRQIISQPLRPGDPVRITNDTDETYISGTLIGRVEGSEFMLVNAYHKALDDKLPQMFETRHVRFDGAS
ncbi:hypothetical protein CPT_Seuss81 [Caulobacter phage Seuss]|uniref:Uncharacterized protein n=1 Tax=Caulobacter phage Seuss TaxID=1675601 RepID=A0A0K1LM61_9CAUD|nr:hypothetical protein HOR08_gp081 [Caulobacter phage Seuss]AKU43607.1 hypothetical protein CPT_Seuss81 [Caulobacter phage Seuss]